RRRLQFAQVPGGRATVIPIHPDNPAALLPAGASSHVATRGTVTVRRRILIGMLAAAVAIVARALLDPLLGAKFPFATVLYGVLVAAWFGGTPGGLVATVISSLAADYLWIN